MADFKVRGEAAAGPGWLPAALVLLLSVSCARYDAYRADTGA